MSDTEQTHPKHKSRPSSCASDNDEFHGAVPTLAARVGVPPRQPLSEPTATFVRPLHASESAKKRKVLAQTQGNTTQPGPLTPSKHRKHQGNLLDQPYTQLETREDQKEWLLLKLELRNSRKNYWEYELEVEELKELMDEASDADMDEGPQRGIGISVETSKTIEEIKAPKHTIAAPPASAPNLSSRKPVPTPKDARPTTKVLKARVNELQNMKVNTHPATDSNRTATNLAGNQHPGSGPLKPTGSSQVRLRGDGDSPKACCPAPYSGRPPIPPHNTNAQQPPPPEGARHSAPHGEYVRHPAPPEKPRRPTPTNGNPHGGRHPPLPGNGEHGTAPPVVQIPPANKDDDADDAATIDNADNADNNDADNDDADDSEDNTDAMDMIRAKMAFECPFPELILFEDDANPDDDNDYPITKTLFQHWAERFYSKAHSIMRRGKALVEREEHHMSYQISQFRNQVKKAAEGRVPLAYGLICGDPQSTVQVTDLTTQDKFLSLNLANDTHQFKHDIIHAMIQAAFFDEPQILGARYDNWLDDMMPRETITFVIQCMIKSYKANNRSSRTLAADKDHAEFERYLHVDAGDVPIRLATEGPAEVEETPIQWEENDSDPDKELRQALRARGDKKREGKGKGKAREAAPAAGPSQSLDKH
ncbi:hypothetical protein FRC06_009851 [Ceratobasidium sp. 370]|nr:hypothetical protein FRC06_009851 [Ceratobasidium sp. 370]